MISYIVCILQAPGLKDPYKAAEAISKLEGVVEHGLFMDMVDVCIVASAEGVKLLNKP